MKYKYVRIRSIAQLSTGRTNPKNHKTKGNMLRKIHLGRLRLQKALKEI